MRESEFRDWLETNGANTESGRNTRVHAVRTIEKKLADLDFYYPDLEAAWEADRFADIREAISRLRTDFDSGGERFRVLMPESERPRNRLSNWRSWLMQYGQFLEGHASVNDADRIRRFVLENYIEPARERDGQSAELVVKDVNDALGLNDAWPNICQAMRGRKFHEMADVPPPQSFGADMSTATRFVFDLAKEDYWALRTLRESLGEPIGQTNKIASFALEDGRQLALDLEAARTQIWLEGSYGHWSVQQVTVTDYPSQKSRNSNLPHRLRHDVPNPQEVSKIEVPNADVLSQLVERYESESGDKSGTGELDPVPIWLVTSLWGQEDGVPRFLERGEWSLLTDTGSANNRRVREMQIGDRIFLKDFVPRATELPFDAKGGIVTANRFRAEGIITEMSEDGLRVGVEWQEWDEPRTWYFYTSNHAVWRLRDPSEKESADRLRRYLLDGEEQDYDWFLNDPFWRDRLFGAPTESKDTIVQPTNLILYGPPGTGKTYRTAREAVRLCDGSVEYGEDAQGRAALMKRYRELVDARQVEMVTFHQSFGYEEFIEGLRPDTDGPSESGGFSLRAESGLFARIADRAQTRVRRNEDGISLEGRKIFKMSLGQSNDPHSAWVFEDSLEQGYAIFGFRDVDWSDERFTSRDEIQAELERRFPDERITPQMGMVKSPDRFRNQLSIGDVIVASKGLNAFRAIGIVEGAYEYAPRPDGRYTHRRKVSWVWSDPDGVPVGELSPDTRFSLDTIYELPRGRLNLQVLERLLNSGPQEVDDNNPEEGDVLPHVLIIDEINRANISKVFGELITLIEPDKRLGMPNALKVRLPYSKREFGVPANLHIIGTMNTADRSIALLDTALRRRFRFEEMAPDTSVEAFLDAERATGLPLAQVLETVNRRIEYLVDRDHRIGHAFFIGCKTKPQVDAVMRDKVIPLLQEYFFEDWNRLAAVLGEKDKGGNFLECKTIEDPMGEGGEPLKSWRVLDSFEEGAYYRLLKRKPSGANSAEVIA
ncbi:AAA family ATPase [Erythrobacter sp. MTPC3]|uniref:AAA family ATPase n=1 Tax=Erythrobacter sp. MTPC3 TaxID=3056564 RepID=UPI0036F3AAA7